MDSKERKVDHYLGLSNEVLHENNTFTQFNIHTNEITHPVAHTSVTSKRTVVSSSGEKKPQPTKYFFSQSQELPDEAGNLVSKSTGSPKESPQILDSSISCSSDVATSTYALQIALKSMKERYQRLQKKISVLEEENGRLINGKSELFSEIGKMQESSIKLREKNLQLNHEVHSKHQECCSLKEQFSSVSKENLKLTSELSHSAIESRRLMKEVEELSKENGTLKDGMEEILSHCRKFHSPHSELLNHIERIVNRSKTKKQSITVAKTRIIPHADDYENLDELKTLTNMDDLSSDIFEFDETKDSESLSVDVCLKTKEFMKKMKNALQVHNQQLQDLKPILVRVSKRKLDSIDLNDDSGEQTRNYLSRYATYGSASNPSGINLSSEDHAACASAIDSGGETNVLVEEIEEEKGKKIPFDWRKVEVSDDEAQEELTHNRPETRTVSTSPDLTLTFDLDNNMNRGSREHSSEEERTCPMCNAIFPLLLPQETFESHVVSHFEVENGFEVIT